MNADLVVAIVAGLSGAGKSTLCEWAQVDLKLLHVEADQPHGDGIDHHQLRSEWNAFYSRNDAAPLSRELRRRAGMARMAGALLSLPGTAYLTRSHLNAAEKAGMRIVIVTGSPECCLAAFLARESASGRGLGEAHWHSNNDHVVAIYSAPEYSGALLRTFESTGERVPRSALMNRLSSAIAA